MKIQDAIWFTEMGATRPIGIVYGEDEITGEKKAYIGTGDGGDKYYDAQHITKFGAKLTLETAKQLLGHLSMNPWIKWTGGECPVPEGTLVDIELQGPQHKQNIHHSNMRGDEYSWDYRGQAKHGHIVAYRLTENK